MIVPVPDGSGRVIEVLTDDPIYASQRAREWAAENPSVERGAELGEEDVSAFGDVFRGIGAGLVGALEGISTLPTELADAITDSDENSSQVIREFFDKYKPETSTGIGEAARFITQFAVPGGAAAKVVKGLGRPAQVGAFAAADIAATTPDVETLGDFLDSGPTKRIETKDLAAAELAQANLANRLKVAAEGAAIVLGVPEIAKLGVRAIGSGAEALGKTDMAKAAARAIADPNTPFKSVGVKPDLTDPNFFERQIESLKKTGRRFLTNQGRMPDEFSAQYEQMRVAQVSAANSAARQGVEKINNALTYANKKEGIFNSQDQSTILNTLNDFLFAESKTGVSRDVVRGNAEKVLKDIDKKIAASKPKTLFGNERDLSLFDGATQLRKQIDGLSDSIIKIKNDPLLQEGSREQLIKTIDGNLGFYGTRIYRAAKETDYTPTGAQESKAIDELIQSTAGLDESSRITSGKAKGILINMLKKMPNNANVNPKDLIDEEVLSGVGQGVLKGRTLDNFPAIRDFLGEYTGAKEVIGRENTKILRARDVAEQEAGLKTKIVDTVDILSKQIAKDNYYKRLFAHNEGLAADKKFLFDEVPPGASLKDYAVIGNKSPLEEITDADRARFGPLAGKYVLKEHQEAFEQAGDIFNLANTMPLYATFLGIKGMSQVAKTVYSPITQIRNATTAGFFALANGNIGSADSLAKSVSGVLTNLNQRLTKVGDFKIGEKSAAQASKADLENYYNDLVDLGVINTNAKVGEFEALLNDALESTKAVPKLAERAFQFAKNRQNGFAAKLYQGSDDVWKAYSFEMELAKLQKAFKNNPNAAIPVSDGRNLLEFGPVIKMSDPKMTPQALETALKREAAEIVKDTVPNYARVPEAIKRLRQLPVGNFIAFPAEIIRTSGNIIQRSIKELASESPEIRAIGMKRLTGMMATNVAIPSTLATAGLLLSGADDEQVQAYKRSMAYEWDRNSTLIPIATDKDGNITEMYNFSYTNPYDYMLRPARAVYNAVANGVTAEKDLSEIAFDASTDSLYEFAAPFANESIVTQKVFDVARNRTDFGAPVYNNLDPLGLKAAKSLAHFAEGLTPGFLPVRLTGDVGNPETGYFGVKFGDFPKAIGSVAGMDPRSAVTRQGYRIDPAQEFAEALTGLKTIKPRVKRTLYYRGVEAARNVRDASAIFNQVAKSRGDVSAEKVTQAYITANEQRFKALRDLNMAIEDAKTLGLSTADIVQPLKEAKTPKLASVLAGKFDAFFPAKETIRIAMQGTEDKLSNPFDFDQITNAYRDFQGAALRPQAAAEAQAAQAPVTPTPTEPQVAPPIAPTQPSTAPTSLFSRGTDALRQIELNKLLGID